MCEAKGCYSTHGINPKLVIHLSLINYMNCNLSIVSTTLICAAAERYEYERDGGPVAASPAAAVQLPPLAPGHRDHPLHPPHPPRHPRQPPAAHHAPQVNTY